ncbi:MAG: diguanylate cyclase [Helicobacteraceae bacterium]|jgi:two-component system glycerol uptake and utilization response regulator|nr:diguanylate cyclase [Helicobacteraceae bacterium]
MATVDVSKSKILIVDDNPVNIDILLELLEGFDVRAVLDGMSALEAVNEELPDLILLDITMPGMDGFEVCRRLKADPKSKNIPVIFLSASADDESIVKGFDLGGVDYVTKPYLAKEIVARIQTHLTLRMAMRTLDRLANLDELSGISNRRQFFARASRLFDQAKDKNIPLFLFIIDIDKFKTINDTYGHATGDKIIRGFVTKVKKNLPKAHCFARLGGDEFVLILAGMRKDQARDQVEQLLLNIEQTDIIPGSDISITISVGMGELKAKDRDIDELLARADINLYEAKKTRNNLYG